MTTTVQCDAMIRSRFVIIIGHVGSEQTFGVLIRDTAVDNNPTSSESPGTIISPTWTWRLTNAVYSLFLFGRRISRSMKSLVCLLDTRQLFSRVFQNKSHQNVHRTRRSDPCQRSARRRLSTGPCKTFSELFSFAEIYSAILKAVYGAGQFCADPTLSSVDSVLRVIFSEKT